MDHYKRACTTTNSREIIIPLHIHIDILNVHRLLSVQKENHICRLRAAENLAERFCIAAECVCVCVLGDLLSTEHEK